MEYRSRNRREMREYITGRRGIFTALDIHALVHGEGPYHALTYVEAGTVLSIRR
jgi:hypothetical protein